MRGRTGKTGRCTLLAGLVYKGHGRASLWSGQVRLGVAGEAERPAAGAQVTLKARCFKARFGAAR